MMNDTTLTAPNWFDQYDDQDDTLTVPDFNMFDFEPAKPAEDEGGGIGEFFGKLFQPQDGPAKPIFQTPPILLKREPEEKAPDTWLPQAYDGLNGSNLKTEIQEKARPAKQAFSTWLAEEAARTKKSEDFSTTERAATQGLRSIGAGFGGTVRQLGESAGSDKLTGIGRAIQGVIELETAEVPPPRVDQVAQIESVGDFGSWFYSKVIEGAVTTTPILAGGALGGWFGGAAAAWGLGVGEVRNELEHAGVTDPERMELYAYTAGSIVGALDSLMPMSVLNSLSGNAKRELGKYVVRRIAVQGAKGMTREGVTEALQEATVIGAAAAAKGEQDALSIIANASSEIWKQRARVGEAAAAGAASGSAFGTAAGVGQEVRGAPRGEADEVPTREGGIGSGIGGVRAA